MDNSQRLLKDQIVKVVSMALEDESFDTFLERFDVTAEDAFLQLYEAGLIDPLTFESFLIDD